MIWPMKIFVSNFGILSWTVFYIVGVKLIVSSESSFFIMQYDSLAINKFSSYPSTTTAWYSSLLIWHILWMFA